MSHRTPVRPADIGGFDTVIDTRSPAEFALDHIPGAVNLPVLDDDERRIVGTLYKQQGAFEARRVGGAMVAANIARHVREFMAERPERWRPLVYCWRGGMRSGSFVQWLRLIGWDAQQLAGGYKGFRAHVIERLATRVPELELRVVCGATGSAKTRVLQALAARGAQVIDLEGLACHKGSLLGALPDRPQPAQKAFETQLARQLDALDPARPVFIEAESVRIGRLSVPRPLIERLRHAPCIEIVASAEARLAYLLRDYAYLGADREALALTLDRLRELQGQKTVERWQAWARAGALPALFAELMSQHYDPHYAKSQEKHLLRWRERATVATEDLDEAGIAALAARIAAVEP
ncbi:MAG: tRNA 2-selenouridine(34) synthase MnmH [Pelomonas sp.]|nr:tRNA 2-selenouridine(34) synthase MnmH [Roseateles sp.]